MALVWSLRDDIGIEAAVIRDRYAFQFALPIPWGIYGTTRGKLATSRKVREFATRAPLHSGNIWPKRRLKASRVGEKDGAGLKENVSTIERKNVSRQRRDSCRQIQEIFHASCDYNR